MKVLYKHISKKTEQIFYVGSGTLSRSKEVSNRSQEWTEAAKGGFYVDTVSMGDNDKIRKQESKLIEQLGLRSEGGLLVNKVKTATGTKSTKIRYNVHLTQSQLDALAIEADRISEPVSRLIRDAIDKYLKEYKE